MLPYAACVVRGTGATFISPLKVESRVGPSQKGTRVPRDLMLALNGPTRPPKKPWNRWYEEAHLPGFKTIDGVKTAAASRLPEMQRKPSGAVHRSRDHAPLIIASVAAY